MNEELRNNQNNFTEFGTKIIKICNTNQLINLYKYYKLIAEIKYYKNIIKIII